MGILKGRNREEERGKLRESEGMESWEAPQGPLYSVTQ